MTSPVRAGRVTVMPEAPHTGPDDVVLLCYDGSEDARTAIAAAGQILGRRRAEVLVVWEAVPIWEPYDPGAILSSTVSRLASRALGLEEIGADLAREKLDEGVRLAEAAGFVAQGKRLRGKPWRVICREADELAADPIVVGARGLGRVESTLLGSVSARVVSHARRPVLVIPLPHPPDDVPPAG